MRASRQSFKAVVNLAPALEPLDVPRKAHDSQSQQQADKTHATKSESSPVGPAAGCAATKASQQV
jgi:hypothetical protein